MLCLMTKKAYDYTRLAGNKSKPKMGMLKILRKTSVTFGAWFCDKLSPPWLIYLDFSKLAKMRLVEQTYWERHVDEVTRITLLRK